MQPRHGGHLLDTVDQQCSARFAQHKKQGTLGRMQSEVHSAVDDEKRPVSTSQDMTHFSNPWRTDVFGCAGQAIHAADFLD